MNIKRAFDLIDGNVDRDFKENKNKRRIINYYIL